MEMLILLIILCILYVISATSYWCIHKHWGIIGLGCVAAYLTLASYVFLMSTYLFPSERLLLPLLYCLLIIIICGAFFSERLFLIERPTQLFLSGTLLFLNIVLLLYANLLLTWQTIPVAYFLYASYAVGISTGTIAGFLFESTFIRFSTKCFYLHEQFIKLLIGLLVSILIIFIFVQFENIPVIAFVLSFILAFWISGLHPILGKKIQRYEYRNF